MEQAKLLLNLLPKIANWLNDKKAFGWCVTILMLLSLTGTLGVAYAMYGHEKDYEARCTEWNITRDKVFVEQADLSNKLDSLSINADKRLSVIEGQLTLLVSHLIK